MARVPYGPPIQDAIARGDLAEMKALAGETEEFLRQHGDVRASLELLKAEIAKRETGRAAFGHGVAPYGPPIHQAIARGDLNEMRALASQAETYLSRTGDISAALALLRAEIAKAEHKK